MIAHLVAVARHVNYKYAFSTQQHWQLCRDRFTRIDETVFIVIPAFRVSLSPACPRTPFIPFNHMTCIRVRFVANHYFDDAVQMDGYACGQLTRRVNAQIQAIARLFSGINITLYLPIIIGYSRVNCSTRCLCRSNCCWWHTRRYACLCMHIACCMCVALIRCLRVHLFHITLD